MCTILIVGKFDCFDPKNEKPMAMVEQYYNTECGFVDLKPEVPVYVEFAPDYGYCTFSAGVRLPYWVPDTAKYQMAKLVLRRRLIFKVDKSSFDQAMAANGDHIITGNHSWGLFHAYRRAAGRMQEMQFYKVVTPNSETLTRGREALKQFIRSSHLPKNGQTLIFLQKSIREPGEDGKEVTKLIWHMLPEKEILNLVSV